MERTAPEAWRIAVLTSGHGRGSNLRALHAYFREHGLPVKLCFATASNYQVPVVDLCGQLEIPCHILNPRRKDEFETRLLSLCASEKIDLIVLAGFMHLLSAEFLGRVGIPVLNIHPALLPKYGGRGMYGCKVHEAVFASGDKFSGVSIHRVDPIYDHGEIIAQTEVDISDCCSAEEIAARVLATEHQTYAPAIYAYLAKIKQ